MNKILVDENQSGNSEDKANQLQEDDDGDLDVFRFDDDQGNADPQPSERKEEVVETRNHIESQYTGSRNLPEIEIKKESNEKPLIDDEFMVEIENSDEEVLEINKEVLEKNKQNGTSSVQLKKELVEDKNARASPSESFRASKDSVASTKTNSFNSTASVKEVEKSFKPQSGSGNSKAETGEGKGKNPGLNFKSGLGQKGKENPTKGPLPNIKSIQKNTKVGNIIDDFDDIGEVGEWVEISANVNKADSENDDDEFEGAFDAKNKKSSHKKEFNIEKNSASAVLTILKENQQEDSKFLETNEKPSQKPKAEKFGIGKTAKKKGGYLNNNLKEKAKYMSLAQGIEPGDNKNSQREREQQEEEKNEDKIDINMEEESKGESQRGTQYMAKEELPSHRNDKDKEEKNNIDMNPELFNKEGTLDEEDWDKISKMTLANVMITNEKNNTEPILFFEAWKVIKSLDLSKEKKMCVFEDNQSFFQKLFSSCTSVKLPGNYLEERDQIFAYAKVPFNDKEDHHFRMLYTIHYLLTKKEKCNRYGSHWVNIGFQGNDPATDLRGVGMLGLLQIIAFLTFHKDLLSTIHAYSLDETYNFPLCIALINMTGFVLKVLRKGKLNRIILQQKSTLNAINNFYFASFYKFYRTYKGSKMTIRELGILKEKVEIELEKNPQKAILDFASEKDKYLKTMSPDKSQSTKKES